MKKVLKISVVVLMIVMIATNVFAAFDPDAIINNVETATNTANVDTGKITKTAGNIIALIRNFAVIAGVVILIVLGIKYMMGSVEEKAGYQKSMIPLVVGVIVVMGATSIASFLFNIV